MSVADDEIVVRLVAEVLGFAADPDVAAFWSRTSRLTYLSWLTEQPTVPKLALVVNITPGQAIAAHTRLLEQGLTLEEHDNGKFSVVLAGPRYNQVLPASLLYHVQEDIEALLSAIANRNYYEADDDLIAAEQELARYRELGFPRTAEYDQAEAAVAAATQALATKLDIYVRQSGIQNPGLRQRLAREIDRLILLTGGNATITENRTTVELRAGAKGELSLTREEGRDGSSEPSYRVTASDEASTADGPAVIAVILASDAATSTVSFRSQIKVFPTPEALLTWLEAQQLKS